ncbi:MAG: phage tail tape measure protein, partial [Labedaea sp.]
LAMALRIAGAGKTIGLTEAQVLGIASALSSVGIEAEAGGSSISTTMIKIAAAVNAGGEQLNAFAKVAGRSGADFAGAFRADPAAAIIEFIQGLGKMQKAGQDVFGVLDQLGLSDIRVRDALLRAAGSADMFTKSIQVGSTAWAENTALTNEANKRYETAASKIQVAGNQIKDALIDVGAVVVPVAAGVSRSASDIAKGFQELPGPMKDIVTWAGAAAGGLTLLGGGAAIAAPKVMDFRDKMRTLEASGGGVSRGLGKVGLFLSGPWGAALGIGAGLLGVFAGAAGGAARRQEELASAGKSVAQALREQNGIINDAVIRTAAKAAEDNHMLSTAKSLGIQLGTVTDAILGQGSAYEQLRTRLQDIIKANTEVSTAGKGGSGRSYNEQALAAQDLLRKLDELVGGKNADVAASRNVDEAAKTATGSQKKFGEATGESAEQAKAEEDAINDLIKALDTMNGSTLSARDAQRQYLQQITDTAEVLGKNGKNLDINTAKGLENEAALDAQAKAALDLAKAASEEAQANGGAAAGAAALTASLQATRPKLIETAKQFGMTQKQAEDYTNAVLAIPAAASTIVSTPRSPEALAELARVREAVLNIPPAKDVNVGVLSQAAIEKLQEIGYKVTTLPGGTVTVSGNTTPAQLKLDEFIRSNQNRIIGVRVETQFSAGAGGKYFAGGFAAGGIFDPRRPVHAYAGGGVEDHQPQVAGGYPGAMRIWAEDPGAKETYLPWAMDRRGRALDIARFTLDQWGWAISPKSRPAGSMGGGTAAYAAGGVTVENLNVTAYSDRFSMSQVMSDLAMSGVR